MHIVHTSSCFVTSKSNIRHDFTLKDMLYVLDIIKNLLSVSKFTRDSDVYFEFHPLICFVKDSRTWEVLLEGKLKQGLYAFDF